MGRALKVSRAKALRSAMNLFWARGFNATTLDEIQEATGLQRGSLYAHFKSKESLFREALELYQIEVVAERRKLVQNAPSAIKGIELFFSVLVEHALKNRKIAGCLNTNTAAELSLIDSEFAMRARNGFKSWEQFWIETLDRAKREGDVPKQKDSQGLARVLITLTQGINIVGKANPDRSFLSDVVKTGLQMLRTHSSSP